MPRPVEMELENIAATVTLCKCIGGLIHKVDPKADSTAFESEIAELFKLESNSCPYKKGDRCCVNPLDTPMCCIGACQLDKLT